MTTDIEQSVRTLAREYDAEGDVDLAGFTGSLATYATAVSALVASGSLSGRRLPQRFETADVLLGGVAVHKLTRLLSKSSVASPLRAPFTEFEEPAGSGEHQEVARGGHGVRHTVGELLTCPFCLGVWGQHRLRRRAGPGAAADAGRGGGLRGDGDLGRSAAGLRAAAPGRLSEATAPQPGCSWHPWSAGAPGGQRAAAVDSSTPASSSSTQLCGTTGTSTSS